MLDNSSEKLQGYFFYMCYLLLYHNTAQAIIVIAIRCIQGAFMYYLYG